MSLLALAAGLSPTAAPAQAAEPSEATAVPSETAAASTPDQTEPLEIQVSAPRRVAHDPREPSLASTVLRREQLTAPGASSADVLARSAGVQVSKSGAESDLATATLRGASGAQTPVYLAGIRVNDDITGTADLSSIPLWLIERVEIYRGNAPEKADQLGLGGAIFFHPKQPPRGSPAELATAAGLSLGSYDSRAAWAMGTSQARGGSTLLAVRQHDANNDYQFKSDNGTRFDPSDDFVLRRRNADTHSLEAWALGNYTLGRAFRVKSVVHAFEREQGVTGLQVLPAERSRARVRRFLAGVSGSSVCGRTGGVADCELELTTSALLSQNSIDDPLFELALASSELTSKGRRLAQSVRLNKTFSESHVSTLRVQQSVESLSLEAAASNAGTGSYDLYRRLTSQLQATHRFRIDDAWSLHGLAALECHTTEAQIDESWCSTREFAGRLGSSWELSRSVSLLTNAGRYVRVPTLGELFGQAPQVGSNATLESETGYSLDAGLRGNVGEGLPRLSVDSFIFYRHVDDGIVFRRSNLGVIRPYNLAESRVLGLEGSARLDATNWSSLDLSATWIDPRDLSNNSLSNRLIPFYSRLTLAPGLSLYRKFHSSAFGKSRVALEPRLLYRSSRVADPAGLITIPAQTSLDLSLSWSLLDERLSWQAAAYNILDAAQFDKVGLPLPGRSFYVSVQVEP